MRCKLFENKLRSRAIPCGAVEHRWQYTATVHCGRWHSCLWFWQFKGRNEALVKRVLSIQPQLSHTVCSAAGIIPFAVSEPVHQIPVQQWSHLTHLIHRCMVHKSRYDDCPPPVQAEVSDAPETSLVGPLKVVTPSDIRHFTRDPPPRKIQVTQRSEHQTEQWHKYSSDWDDSCSCCTCDGGCSSWQWLNFLSLFTVGTVISADDSLVL